MRTTLTLDPDVERLVREEMHRIRRPFKQVINDAVRRGLAPGGGNMKVESYAVRPHHAHLRTGFDPGALNRLADEIEDEERSRKQERG